MSRPMTDTPTDITKRVRLHRKRKKLLSDLQHLVYSKDNKNALTSLEKLVEALQTTTTTTPTEEDNHA